MIVLLDGLKGRKLIQAVCHKEIIVSHRGQHELLVYQVIKYLNFAKGPIARVWVQLIGAFPYLVLFIEHPYAMIVHIV